MKIRDARSLSSEAQEDMRNNAVRAVLRVKKQVEVAEMFSVTRQVVGKWIKSYRQEGPQALKAKQKGRPQGGSLQSRQQGQIIKALINKTPDQLKLTFYLWTREAVLQLIEKRYGLRLSVWTVGRYLVQWGFTPQKPVRRAFKQNEDEVRRWLTEQYPEIRKAAKREKAVIFWGDETGMRPHCWPFVWH